MTTTYDLSAHDPRFLDTVGQWVKEQGEVAALIRFSRLGGQKQLNVYKNFESFKRSLDLLPAETSIIVFREKQLQMRGPVTDAFIGDVKGQLVEGAEYAILCLDTTDDPNGAEWRAGCSHSELTSDLHDFYGRPVAVGLYPPWLEQTDSVISATVAGPDGKVQTGVY